MKKKKLKKIHNREIISMAKVIIEHMDEIIELEYTVAKADEVIGNQTRAIARAYKEIGRLNPDNTFEFMLKD